MTKSRYSLPRLENLLGRAIAHGEGHHLTKLSHWAKTDPMKRGKVINQKRNLAGSILSRINRTRMTQSKP
jgi:hypothetical protein